jgi:hypothetical protein
MMHRDSGTAFIDTLVAAAIVALALGTMYRVTADTAHRTAAVSDSRAALMIAQSQLAAVGYEVALAPGETRGRQGPFVWRVAVVPATGGASNAGRLWQVTVSAGRDGAPASVTLQTLRLGPGA